jgi:diadenosine tetraphosphatase ApaH/serine/threonine PP2A family protein phosphatase
MKIAFMSCIHSNISALEAVGKDIEAQGVDKVYCLGDIVGYGAYPRECVDYIRSRKWPTVLGNHDFAVLNPAYAENFTPAAKMCSYFSMGALTPADRDWLRALPLRLQEDTFEVVHASPHDPPYRNYIMTDEQAIEAFQLIKRPWVFHGHTHVPLAFFGTDPLSYDRDSLWKLDPAEPALLNVGSVGQPRDKDPRSAYGLFDADTREVHIRRVEYNVKQMVADFKAAGLPEKIADRLLIGA